MAVPKPPGATSRVGLAYTRAFDTMKADPSLGRAEAMRRAMASLIAGGGRLSHPANWAPFVVVGKGGAGR